MIQRVGDQGIPHRCFGLMYLLRDRYHIDFTSRHPILS